MSTNEGKDIWADINVRAAIAFALAIIALVLVLTLVR